MPSARGGGPLLRPARPKLVLGRVESAHLWVCRQTRAPRECVMAIYSLHHTAVGKTTQAQPYTASAHIRYITRVKALSRLDGARMPVRRNEAAAWLRKAEDSDRKNARVIDKVMLALPRELTLDARVALVKAFAEAVTLGRASWLAAFHQKGKDARNPHCHLVIRDRDAKTGKRVIGMSEAGSTERLRQLWETFANKALHKAGRSERIDRRTLRAQGVDRAPTIHEGVRAQEMHKRGACATSKTRHYRNGKGARRAIRTVDYRAIDDGRSRPAYNNFIRNQRAEIEREYWKIIEQDSQHREIKTLQAIHRPDLGPSPDHRPSDVDHWFNPPPGNRRDYDLER